MDAIVALCFSSVAFNSFLCAFLIFKINSFCLCFTLFSDLVISFFMVVSFCSYDFNKECSLIL
jgi:hypothetical protein